MTRLHILIPDKLALELERRAGKRGRGRLLTDLAEKELRRIQLLDAINAAAGELADVPIPGWDDPDGAVEWVKAIRRQSEKRLTRNQA